MCKVGDIILIESYKHNPNQLPKHSFIVIDDKKGKIAGLEYDFIANVMSSVKSEEQKKRKLLFPGNMEVLSSDQIVPNGNGKDAYVKAEQFYFFEKSKIKYKLIGNVTEEFLNELMDFIESLDIEIERILDNL